MSSIVANQLFFCYNNPMARRPASWGAHSSGLRQEADSMGRSKEAPQGEKGPPTPPVEIGGEKALEEFALKKRYRFGNRFGKERLTFGS